MFSQRRSHYWSQQGRTHYTTCCIVALLYNSVCSCFALLRFITTWKFLRRSFSLKGLVQSSKKSQRKKKSLQHHRAKRIKRQLYGKYYKMFASKNDWSKWPARREFDRSSPRSGRTLSVDRPLFWALKEQSQSVCNIERGVGGYKGRQVWKNLKSKTFKSCLI